MLVSHDRTFLARTVTHVVELDEFTHRAAHYGGGWQAYLDERESARRAAWERFEDYDTQRRTLARRAQREREWASQGLSKARKSDEPDKNIRAFKIDQTEQLAGRAARTERAMERLEAVDKPREPWQLRLQVASPGRSGDVVARLDGAVARRGSFELGPIDLLVGAGERIALVGANGSGKTTLIDVLLGRAELVAGRCAIGPSVVVGEVEQARDRLDGPASLLRAFQDATGIDAGDVRTLLAKFGLVADHVTRPTSTLSPGERTRATLALLQANGANLLVLDEPTNHLDLPAIEQLEAALDTFDGTVLLVTHDRSLLEQVRLTRRIELVAGRIVSDDGDVTGWRREAGCVRRKGVVNGVERERRRRRRRCRVRRPAHALPPAPAGDVDRRAGVGRRRGRHVVLEPLPGRPVRHPDDRLHVLVRSRAGGGVDMVGEVRHAAGDPALPPARR